MEDHSAWVRSEWTISVPDVMNPPCNQFVVYKHPYSTGFKIRPMVDHLHHQHATNAFTLVRVTAKSLAPFLRPDSYYPPYRSSLPVHCLTLTLVGSPATGSVRHLCGSARSIYAPSDRNAATRSLSGSSCRCHFAVKSYCRRCSDWPRTSSFLVYSLLIISNSELAFCHALVTSSLILCLSQSQEIQGSFIEPSDHQCKPGVYLTNFTIHIINPALKATRPIL